ENFPDWKVQLQESYAKDGAAFLSIHATDPDLLQDVDSSRVAKASKAAGQALKEFQRYIMNDWVTWTVISIPTVKWAEKIYPNKTGEDAVQALWETIYTMTRVDKGDPIKEWETHNSTLENASALLNKKQYQKTIFGKVERLFQKMVLSSIRIFQPKKYLRCLINIKLKALFPVQNL